MGGDGLTPLHALPLHPSVLEPHFDLPLGEVQVYSDLISAEPGQVVVMSKLSFELPQLLLGEGCPLLAGLAGALWLRSILLVV